MSRDTRSDRLDTVAVGEDLALRLPVVGQHHDAVVALGLGGHPLELAEEGVEPHQRVEGLGPHDAGVVGDRVVVDVVDVDAAGTGGQCLPDHDAVEVAHDAVEGAPLAREVPAAVHPGAHVLPDLPAGLGPLADQLARGAHHPAHEAVGPHEKAVEPAPAVRVAAGRAPTRLIVAKVVGASPLNRLLTDTPPSARSPCPSECIPSMSTASAGLLATKTRPVARSTQRKAGIPSVVPCRIPIWLAGVVAGSVGVHSMNWWLPSRIHRDRVGRVPPMTPHWRTGKGTPSSCTNRMPVTSGSAHGLAASCAAQEVREDGVIGAGRHDPRGQGGDGGDHPGRPEGREEGVDRHPGHDREGDVGHARLPEQGQDQGADHPEGGGERDQHRPDHQPHDSHDQRHQHDRPPALEGDAGQDPAGQGEANDARQQGHERPPHVGPVETGTHGPAHDVSSRIGGYRRRDGRGPGLLVERPVVVVDSFNGRAMWHHPR